MKKIITIITITMLLALTAVPVFAAYAAGDSADIDVYANYHNPENVYTAELENGKYTVSISGLSLAVTPKSDAPSGLHLMVRIISTDESEAYAWFSGCTEEIGDNIQPYEIYWIDDDGNHIDADGEQVEITLPTGYERPAVCGITTDGSATKLDSEAAEGSLVFTANGSRYYALVQTPVPSQTDDENTTDSQSPIESTTTAITGQQGGEDDIPKTGSEHSVIALWVAISLVSAGALAVSVKKKQAE